MENELVSLGLLFLFAIIGGIIATRFRQPAVIGLLLVGALIGPNALNIVRDHEMISMMAEFGAILLLFVIGLEFVIPKMMKIGFKALLIGTLKIGIILFMVYEMAIALGLSPATGIILGGMLSVSSTVVIVKILESKGLYHREEMPLLIGMLLVEDLFAVVVLTFLSSARAGSSALAGLEQLIISLTILLVAYILALKMAKFAVSWMIENSGEEVITFLALGICAGFSYLAYLLGIPAATGAFLAGSIVASLPEVKLFEHAIKPYTLTFTSLFFISVGTMVNLASIKNTLPLIIVLLLLTVLSRFIAVGMISSLFANFTREQTIFSSLAFISVGEFSLLIAQMANPLMPELDLVSIAAFIIFITAIIMSLSISHYSRITDIFANKTPSHWYSKPKSLSRYIKMLFDEIDTEGTLTTRFKKHFFSMLTYMLFAVFLAITWRRISEHMSTVPDLISHVIHAAFIVALTCFGVKLVQKATKVYRSLATILANTDCAGDEEASRIILNKLLRSIGLLTLVIASPLIIIVAHLPLWANLLPAIAMIAVAISLRGVLKVVHDYSKRNNSFPSYRKVDLRELASKAAASENADYQDR